MLRLLLFLYCEIYFGNTTFFGTWRSVEEQTAASSSKTLPRTYPFTRCHIPDSSNPNTHHSNNLISLYTWVRASWMEFNNCPPRCDLFSLLHFCRQLYMFRVLTPITRSSYNHNYSFWYWLTGLTGTDSCVSYSTYRTIHMNQLQLNNESGW